MMSLYCNAAFKPGKDNTCFISRYYNIQNLRWYPVSYINVDIILIHCPALGWLLCVERIQLRWLGHLIRRPRGRPRTRGRDYISTLAWERLWTPNQSWLIWLSKGKFGVPCWSCCAQDPTADKRDSLLGKSTSCVKFIRVLARVT